VNETTLPPAPAWVRLAATVVRRLPAGRYRAIEWLGRRAPPPFVMAMPAALGGARYHCDLRDSIARDVCFAGMYAPQETAVVRSLLGPGASFVDVGANWGYFTLLGASLVGDAGRVVSLEPDPRLFRVLGENVERNGGLRQVGLLQVAAAERPGSLMLAGFDETEGNFGLSRIVREPGSGEQVFQVRAQPLDEIFEEQGLERIDLLKMDIEGAEGAAIAGMRDALLKRKVRRLLVEIHPNQMAEQGYAVEAAVAALRSAGYVGYTVDHRPAATRAAAYGRLPLARMLAPLSAGGPADPWPHHLWCAPGAEPRW
jgi:FkbM family methyltransferase